MGEKFQTKRVVYDPKPNNFFLVLSVSSVCSVATFRFFRGKPSGAGALAGASG